MANFYGHYATHAITNAGGVESDAANATVLQIGYAIEMGNGIVAPEYLSGTEVLTPDVLERLPTGRDYQSGIAVYGEVEWNQIPAPPLGTAGPGTPIVMSFQVDSEDFVNSPSFPIRVTRIRTFTSLLWWGSWWWRWW